LSRLLSGGEQLEASWLLPAIALLITSTATSVLMDTVFFRRVSRLSVLLENRVASSHPYRELDEIEGDEFGRLISAVNAMAALYRKSFRALARRADELATLNRIAETINRTLDLQEVFDISLRGAIRAVDWDMGSIYMWDDQSETLNMVSYEGLTDELVRSGIIYRLGDSITGKAAQARQMIIVEDTRKDPEAAGYYQPGMPITQISIPLLTVPGQMVGVLNVSSSEFRSLTPDDLYLLMTIAHQVAVAIDKAQLYTKVSRHAVELERIVDARTKQLAQVIDELVVAVEQSKEAEKLKSMLLSTVSHELRTPLATIKGNTSMLREHYQKVTPDLLVEHLTDIEEETDKLTDLISNLLDMSRIEAGILQILPHVIDLTPIVRSAVQAAQMRQRENPMTLIMEDSLPPCIGDARRIEQIIANLLDNAAKYSASGKPIEIRVESRDKNLIVSVEDQGRGIDPDHLERIFDRFYQIEKGGDSGRHGIGLGLAICRGLVEAHGGGIWADSQQGRGSIFSFSLPVAKSETLAEERWHETDYHPDH
jgi:K+-sensing histidine kinase KdpD